MGFRKTKIEIDRHTTLLLTNIAQTYTYISEYASICMNISTQSHFMLKHNLNSRNIASVSYTNAVSMVVYFVFH